MNHQQAFKLDKPVELLPPRKVHPRCPSPKGQKTKRHFVFDNIDKFPPPPRSNLQPLPPWTCDMNVYGFETEKDLKIFLGSNCISNIWKVWLCGCGFWHYECYPLDLTGQTSGKCVRKEWWLVHRKGYTIELDENHEAQVVKPQASQIPSPR